MSNIATHPATCSACMVLGGFKVLILTDRIILACRETWPNEEDLPEHVVP